jgi:hypothetical protein
MKCIPSPERRGSDDQLMILRARRVDTRRRVSESPKLGFVV